MDGTFSVKDYIKYDDWTIYAALKKGLDGKHGDIILNRKHYKCINQTQLIPTKTEQTKMAELEEEYKGKEYYLDNNVFTQWYKLDKDILIYQKDKIQPLSEKSSIVKSMVEKPTPQRFYVEQA